MADYPVFGPNYLYLYSDEISDEPASLALAYKPEAEIWKEYNFYRRNYTTIMFLNKPCKILPSLIGKTGQKATKTAPADVCSMLWCLHVGWLQRLL